MASILVIDDNLDICQLLDRFLTKKGHQVQTTISGKTGLEYLKKTNFDLILCDFKLREMDGRDILKKVKESSPDTQLVIITGYADVKVAVEVIKNGALDYITKPLIPDEILLLIDKALNLKRDPKSNITGFVEKALPSGTKSKAGPSSNYFRGISKESKKLYEEIKLVAPTNMSVIIYGESGAGKENIAEIIHQQSNRSGKPFIAIDCGALTRELAGSELWGHEKGAFTGAHSEKPGQFELADGGTIFLDEISNLSYEIQVGLLRLVQERRLRRIGGTKDRSIDVRILVASNEDLRKSVQEGKFREDLYFRFNEFSITVPALRDRKEDIEPFANYFLEMSNEELKKEMRGFDADVMEVFRSYPWPGNLREMRNVIRRASLLSQGEFINLSGLPPELVYSKKLNFLEGEENTIHDEAAKDPHSKLKSAAAGAEATILRKVLEEVKYNRTKAALELGIDRKTLFNKMKQYDL